MTIEVMYESAHPIVLKGFEGAAFEIYRVMIPF